MNQKETKRNLSSKDKETIIEHLSEISSKRKKDKSKKNESCEPRKVIWSSRKRNPVTTITDHPHRKESDTCNEQCSIIKPNRYFLISFYKKTYHSSGTNTEKKMKKKEKRIIDRKPYRSDPTCLRPWKMNPYEMKSERKKRDKNRIKSSVFLIDTKPSHHKEWSPDPTDHIKRYKPKRTIE